MRSKVLSEGSWVGLTKDACFPLTCNVKISHKIRESRTEHEGGKSVATKETTRWKKLSSREESRSFRIDYGDGAAVLDAFAKRKSGCMGEVEKKPRYRGV